MSNEYFLSEVQGIVTGASRLRTHDTTDKSEYDLYPALLFRRERNIFNRVQVRYQEALLAYPARTAALTSQSHFSGKLIKAVGPYGDGSPPSIRHFTPNTIFWLANLETTQNTYDKTMFEGGVLPAPLPLKTRLRHAAERALFQKGGWLSIRKPITGLPNHLGFYPNQPKP